MEVMETDSADAVVPPCQQRLVHLDLKGAPPKIDYYRKIFPKMKDMGATGLLIEYEDMFPYTGELKQLSKPTHYSENDIQIVLKLAEENDLSVIPLVQTFGHFEFVLKYDSFRHLREVENYPMALCPKHPEVLPLVIEMVTQVLKHHPRAKWFHIGADEVFHIGVCSRCEKHRQVTSESTLQMFLSYVKSVLEAIRSRFPDVRLIMWDDMFREAPVDVLLESGIGELVEPMVWYYARTHEGLANVGVWERYAVVFEDIWGASAFKGATGPCTFVTDIGHHVENHRIWIRTIKENQAKFKSFRGLAITGWQRYDHYCVLCELFPVALPSLAVCLRTFTQGHFTEEIHKKASDDLNFSEVIPLNPFLQLGSVPECAFPGKEIYCGAQTLLALNDVYKFFFSNDRLNGWMTDYHVRRNFTNPAHINSFLGEGKRLLTEFIQLKDQMKAAMCEVYYDDCIEEWIEVNLESKMKKLKEVLDKAEAQLKLNTKLK